jgi:hypothetical protein
MFKTAFQSLVVGLALIVSALPNVSEAAQSPTLTISQLKQNWQRYDGRTVQLRGQFGGCGAVCDFCPLGMTNATYDPFRCIQLFFGRQNSDPTERVVHILTGQVYRFAEVTIEARFNAVCLLDEMGHFVGDMACTDGPANLDNVRVLTVHARRPIPNVVFGGTPEPLVPAPPAERDAMLAEYRAINPTDLPWPVEMFLVQYPKEEPGTIPDPYPDPQRPDGLGCMCLTDLCEGRWPKMLLVGPADPYQCWFMRKTANGWRVMPHDFWWGGTP